MIDLERWLEIKQIVQDALDRPPGERAAYLARVCGDDEQLRREVEALLAVSSTHAEIIDSYQVLPVSVRKANLNEGDEVGPYRIIRPLGEGGMGAVYLAHDTRHERLVALKTVPRRSERVLREEQRLLAKLQHPNIAALYDSGVTEDGFGYFIMEYVEGEPITTYCETHKLTLKERLELFLPVCDAVSVAHRDLIVHRDIKPSNILVTKDGKPKLLDFGIAKLLPSEPGLLPEALSFTPPFASPEQLEGEHTTTATDIYSLGVLLCLLLTGRLPYPVKSYGDLPWAIRNMEPEKPSQLVLKIDVGLDADARPAPVPPADSQRLARRLRGDLDAIVLRALQKDAGKRYQSIQGFAEDISRTLSNKPVVALRSTRSYRAKKFIRRHTVAVVSAAIVLLAILGFSVALLLQYKEVNRQRDLAVHEAQQSEELETFLVEMFIVPGRDHTAALQVPVGDLLATASQRAKTHFAHDPIKQALFLSGIGEIYGQLGDIDTAESLIHDALNTYEQRLGQANDRTASMYNNLGWIALQKGELTKSEQFYTKSLNIRRRILGEYHPRTLTSIEGLAAARSDHGDYQGAEQLHRKVLTLHRIHDPKNIRDIARSMSNISTALARQKKMAEAELFARQALALRRKALPAKHPDIAASLNTLATLLNATGAFTEAESLHREALSIRRSVFGQYHTDTAQSTINLATVLTNKGTHLKEATELYQQALTIYRTVFGEKNSKVAITQNNIAILLVEQGKLPEAEQWLRQALSTLNDLPPNDSQILKGIVLRSLASLQLDFGDYQEAENLSRQSIATFSLLSNKSVQRQIVQTQYLLGASLAAQGQCKEAHPLVLESFPAMLSQEVNLKTKQKAIERADIFRSKCGINLPAPQ